jgi:hypothetical protein
METLVKNNEIPTCPNCGSDVSVDEYKDTTYDYSSGIEVELHYTHTCLKCLYHFNKDE